MTVGRWLAYAERRLTAVGVESPRLEAQVLASHVLLIDRSALLAHPDEEFPELAGEALLALRERHEPLAYIVGRREFFGRSFVVSPSVLIPRQETETLVEAALAAGDELHPLPTQTQTPIPAQTQTQTQTPTPTRVLDIGVGSGAIALTLKLERPAWLVTGVDISPDALTVAAENAALLDADVRLLQSDVFSALEGETFDLIVCNPPYVAESESLPTEVRDFEPRVALFSGPTGLEFYERLAASAAEFLSPDGRLLVEIGYRQADSVPALFVKRGWSVARKVKDLTAIERVVDLRPPPTSYAGNVSAG